MFNFKAKKKYKSSQFHPARGLNKFSGGSYVTEDTCMQVSAFNSGVVYLSTQIAKLPWHVKDRDNKILFNDPINVLLNVCPNDWMSAFNFRLVMTQLCIIKGNAYAEIERNTRGQPVALHVLRSEDVMPYLLPDGTLVYRILNASISQPGSDVYMQPNDIFHIRNFHTKDGVVGQGVVSYATETLGISLGSDKFANSLFANAGLPSGVISVDGILDEEAIDRMKQGWQSQFGGRKVGGTAVLEQGAKYEPISQDPQVLQFLESRKFSVQEIARFLRVPPQKLYDTDSQKYNNVEHSNLEVITDTLDAWMRNYESEADIKLLNKQRGGKNSQFDVMAVFRADLETRVKYYNGMMQSASMTPNEIRVREGLSPYEDGDKYYIANNNYAPVDRLDEIIDSQVSKSDTAKQQVENENELNDAVLDLIKRK